MDKIMQWHGGSVVVTQPGICFVLPHFFRSDEVHLLLEGCNIYLSNLEDNLFDCWDWGGGGKLG